MLLVFLWPWLPNCHSSDTCQPKPLDNNFPGDRYPLVSYHHLDSGSFQASSPFLLNHRSRVLTTDQSCSRADRLALSPRALATSPSVLSLVVDAYHLPTNQARSWPPLTLLKLFPQSLACPAAPSLEFHLQEVVGTMHDTCLSLIPPKPEWRVLLLSHVTVEHNLFTTQYLENKTRSLQLSHILYPLHLQKQQAFWLKSSTWGHVYGSPSAVDMFHLASLSFREHLLTVLPWHPKLSLSELSP